MSEFQRELEQSLYLHRALPLHREREYEARFYDKKVLAQKPVGAQPAVEGAALLTEGNAYTITAPLRCEPWPKEDPGAVDYRNFGTARLSFSFPQESWEGYHRLRFSVKPQILGARICHLNLAAFSDGKHPVPDRYFREGATVFDLKNGEWNDCIWEFNAMDRDAVHRLEFYVFRAGHDVGAGNELTYTFKDIRLEQIDAPEHELGWENPTPGIRLSSVGYFQNGKKTAVATTDAKEFSVQKLPEGQTVFTGTVEQVENARGHFSVLDFSALQTPGHYRLKAGTEESCEFEIGDNIQDVSFHDS